MRLERQHGKLRLTMRRMRIIQPVRFAEKPYIVDIRLADPVGDCR